MTLVHCLCHNDTSTSDVNDCFTTNHVSHGDKKAPGSAEHGAGKRGRAGSFLATLYQPYGDYKIVRIKGRKGVGKAKDSASPPFER